MKINHLLFIINIFITYSSFAQTPSNDDCDNAIDIGVSNNGFGLGIFSSTPTDFAGATLQPGESFDPGFSNTDATVWYTFTIATARDIEIALRVNGASTSSTLVSLTVYYQPNCNPVPDATTRLLQLSRDASGSKTLDCQAAGTYYIQLAQNNAFNDEAFVEVTLSSPSPQGDYDLLADAYDLGVVSDSSSITYSTGCHTIDSTAEQNCPAIANAADYTQSSWHVFTTDNWVDYIGVLLESATNTPFATPVGYWLYEGDLRTTAGTVISGCNALTYPINAQEDYICELKPNSTYTIKLLFDKDFDDDITVTIRQLGADSTQAPVPVLSQMSTDNILNAINPGSSFTINDNFACNALLTDPAVYCGTVNTPNTVLGSYDLVTWVSFYLTDFANVNITADQPGAYSCSNVYIRLFADSITDNCADLSPSNIISASNNNINLNCLPPGPYSIQLLGASQIPNNVWDNCASNFGRPLDIVVQTQLPSSLQFGLQSASDFNGINGMAPLPNNSNYTAVNDVFGCDSTVIPMGASACYSNISQTIYRELTIGDGNATNNTPEQGLLTISDLRVGSSSAPLISYQFFYGDASAQASANNTFTPGTFITGLTDYSGCIDWNTANTNISPSPVTTKFCVTQGTYTLASYGDTSLIGLGDRPRFGFEELVTQHNSAANAEDLGTIVPGTITYSTIDRFSCDDNAVTIDGVAPCNGATKAIYREFYLSDTAILDIGNLLGSTGYLNLFYGRASVDGIPGLAIVNTPDNAYNCISGTNYFINCDSLAPGWYTVVAYGDGPNYTNFPYPDLDGGMVGDTNAIYVMTISDSVALYNRPYKACPGGTTDWGPNRNTADYPVNDSLYTLCTETFGCPTDLPLLSHPIDSCSTSDNRVAYYTFSITQPSFVVISGITSNINSKVFPFDVRTDSVRMTTDPPVQPCLSGEGYIQLCDLQPGDYTLVLLVTDASLRYSVTPTIYIDSVGISKFDHAQNAYDFGVLTADIQWYNGAAHLASTPGIAPSNDFFFCSTGAQTTDPDNFICGDSRTNWNVNSRVYPFTPDQYQFQNGDILAQPRRNLWYTFVVDYIGRVDVKVDNKTPNKTTPYPFAIYRSDVNGTIPFSQLQLNGGIDSTITDGLTLVATNEDPAGFLSCNFSNMVSFANCSSIDTVRYYVLIDNPAVMYPNSQVEVSVRFDSVPVRYDFCYTANTINGLNQVTQPYTPVILNYDTVMGDPASLICATADPNDASFGNCQGQPFEHTVWYKINVGVTGRIKIALEVEGRTDLEYIPGDILLLMDADTNLQDCSAAGLIDMPLTTVANGADTLGESCVTPGTYYIMITGCSYFYERVTPVVSLSQDQGDTCDDPVVQAINGGGSSSATVTIDCHTMGNDFGEDGSNISCLDGPAGFKSTWFRVDLTGSLKYDLEFCLSGTVTATPVLYRLLYGSCGSMSVDISSCSSQGNCFTIECLAAGSYYLQVFSPENAIGDLSLSVNSTQNLNPTCNPIKPGFTWTTNCDNDSVYFTNTSSGTFLTYDWNFGSAGVSTEVSPTIAFPSTNSITSYNITLTASDTVSGGDSTITETITVYPKPDLDNDTTLCPGESVTLQGYTGGTFVWQDGSTASSFTVTTAGLYYLTDSLGCSDSILVDYSIAPIPRLADTTVCAGDTVLLDAGNNGATYQWSTSQSTQTIQVVTNGLYKVTITNSIGCSIKDSSLVTFTPLPTVDAGNDTTICAGQSVTLSASGAQTYIWNSNTTVTPLTTDTFSVTGTDANNCSNTDEIIITVADSNLVPVSIEICPGDSVFAGGSWQFTNGQYVDIFTNTNNCDSTVITQLTLLPVAIFTVDTTICIGESVFAGGMAQTTAGTYFDTLQGANTCDSIVTTILSVDTLPIISVAPVTDTVCLGGTATFTASGGNTYVWNNSETTNSISVSPSQSTSYWVDVTEGACTVRETAELVVNNLPAVNITSSGLACPGDTITLTANSTTANNYLWSPSGTNASIDITQEGTYTVTVTDVNGCQSADTFTAIYYPEVGARISATDPLCYGIANGSIIVDSTWGTAPFSYQWSNSRVTANNTQIKAGTYTLTITDGNGCIDSITSTLTDPDSLGISDIRERDITCYNYNDGYIEIQAFGGTGNLSYSIDNAETFVSSAQFTDLEQGYYNIWVKDDNNCTISSSRVLYIYNPPAISVNLEPDSTMLKFAQALELKATPSNNVEPPLTYNWTPYDIVDCDNCADPIAEPIKPGYIGVQLIDSLGCIASDSIYVFVDIYQKIFYAPNAFTPNGDNRNDMFKIYSQGVKKFELQIFDRWGEIVFTSNDITIGWDGTYNGDLMTPETYVYTVRITYLDDKEILQKGSFVLIR